MGLWNEHWSMSPSTCPKHLAWHLGQHFMPLSMLLPEPSGYGCVVQLQLPYRED